MASAWARKPGSGQVMVGGIAERDYVGAVLRGGARLRPWLAAFGEGRLGFERSAERWRRDWAATLGVEAKW